MATLIPAENFQINAKAAPIITPGTFTSSGPAHTFTLGKNLALQLEKGSVVAISGPLGAGKTCFAKGIALGLGVKEEITSPTYTIVSEYQGACFTVYHIDAYRLKGDDDFYAIGGEEIIYGKGISIIEWCENIEGFISKGAYRVDIKIRSEEKRLINIHRVE